MRKTILIVVAIVIALMITSCGHNMVTQSKGIGIDVSWTGENYVPNIKLGYWDETSAAVRGNANVSASTASGGGLMVGEGGTSQTFQIATGTQINEGYIKDILIDPNIDTEAKVAFIKALTKLECPATSGSINKTTSAESTIMGSEGLTEEELEAKQAKDAEEAIDELVQKLEAMEKAKAEAVSETKEAVNKASGTGTASSIKVEAKPDTAPKAVPATEQK